MLGQEARPAGTPPATAAARGPFVEGTPLLLSPHALPPVGLSAAASGGVGFAARPPDVPRAPRPSPRQGTRPAPKIRCEALRPAPATPPSGLHGARPQPSWFRRPTGVFQSWATPPRPRGHHTPEAAAPRAVPPSSGPSRRDRGPGKGDRPATPLPRLEPPEGVPPRPPRGRRRSPKASQTKRPPVLTRNFLTRILKFCEIWGWKLALPEGEPAL